MIAFWLKTAKPTILAVTAILVGWIAIFDWSVGNTFSLGILYILPMVLAAVRLSLWEMAALSLLCAYLRSRFDVPGSQTEVYLRFAFAFASYFASGLLVSGLVRNRRLVAEHLARMESEQKLRREAEEQLSVLVASSPAAILTLDGKGLILAANHAAYSLLAIPEGEELEGRLIEGYLPVLADALRMETLPEGFRTAAQCQGHREDGEIFLAHSWFSSYQSPHGTRLAAIVVDTSEEMREREEQNLQELHKSNRITAAAVSHELRNLSGAVSLVCLQLQERHPLAQDADFQGLVNLVKGMEKVTSLDLYSRGSETLERMQLQPVLDSLRIVIEPNWKEIGGRVRWNLPSALPLVMADPHGLLQVFLNLARNSHRAVQETARRELDIVVELKNVELKQGQVLIHFEDSGPGITSPQHLFQAFQQGANGAGLGLYVSRAVVRSYGGDLRFDPHAGRPRFTVELQVS
jgi:C4-dicarboxylate-specific signal transduction histidine kinase